VVAAFAALRSLDADVDLALVGIAGLLACALLARLVAARVAAVAKTTGSAALAADARSLQSSQATAVLAAAALALVLLLDTELPDTVGGLLISAVVVRVGIELVQAALPGRERVGARELEEISAALAGGPPEVVGYGRIAARTAAGVRRIDIDVMLRGGVDGRRMAAIAEELRAEIGRRIPGRRLVLHLRKPARSSPKASGRNRGPGQ
jgi:divalent metal cation (Fe/Co/Zn/Cd) transporter